MRLRQGASRGGFSALQRAEIAEILFAIFLHRIRNRFSALQRAEIAEIFVVAAPHVDALSFSALQRAEIAENWTTLADGSSSAGFSALQRAEIAEIDGDTTVHRDAPAVSVLFNEPKLLKYCNRADAP